MTEQVIEIDGKMYRLMPVEDKPEPEAPKPRRTGYERAKSGSIYWITGSSGKPYAITESHVSADDCIYEASNYVTDEGLAERRARRDRLMWQLERFAVEHRQKQIVWCKDNTVNYCIFYDHNCKKFQIKGNYKNQDPFNIYFDTEKTARAAIEEFKDELTWYFTEYRDCV